MDRFLTALLTFFLVLFAQIFALAASEGFGGMRIDPFGSRNTLLVVMLGVSVGAAILRASKAGSRPAQSSSAGSDTVPPHAAAVRATDTQPPDQRSTSDRRSAAMLAAASRQAILFRQHFPPRHDLGIRSFFGGAPIAPRDFLWPRSGGPMSQGMPLHFLLQIDCADVPTSARLGALPSRGVLYFFLDLSWETSGGRVLYADPSANDYETISAPADLGPAFGKHAAHNWGWTQTVNQCPALLPRWTFEPIVIELPEIVRDEEDDEGAPVLWPERSVAERLLEAQGDASRYDYLTVRDVMDGKSVRRPFQAFPHDWRALQICSNELVRRADRERGFPQTSAFHEMNKDQKDALLTELSAEAQSWFDRGAAQPPFDEVPRTDRDEFWELMARHPHLTRSMLVDALTQSVEASLAHSDKAASRVPAELAARIRGRHALAVMTDAGIHANIPDRMLAPPVDVQGNQWERAQTHLLLLEISSNEGLGHHFGEGVFQFWITPEDLRSQRFDKVEVTSDAY